MELITQGKGKMFLHTSIGEGNMPDGRKVRLIQTNGGIHMQVYPLPEKVDSRWDTYTLTYDELSQCIFKEVEKIEKV